MGRKPFAKLVKIGPDAPVTGEFLSLLERGLLLELARDGLVTQAQLRRAEREWGKRNQSRKGGDGP